MSLNMQEFFALQDDWKIEVKKTDLSVIYKVIGHFGRGTGEILVVNLDDGSQGTVHLHWDFRLGVVDQNGRPFEDFNACECQIRH